jgi:SAM-dependent methyltransferase
MLLYASTIFLSAFLLFLVQPVMAKEILPWFGGSAAVWTTCLVFFQTALLAGYAYCDLTVRRLSPRAQVKLHAVLLLASLAVLPIIPAAHWKPDGAENPLWLILGMLVATIGLPYFLLSTTSPLVQVWFARAHAGASPYRLFALSNLASLLGLAGYPFLLEPWAPTRAQAIGWSAGYAAFVLLCALAGWTSVSRLRRPAIVTADVSTTHAMPARDGATAEPPPTAARQALWCALAATGSLLLLAVSNHITQNIASVPLLWIVPLTIYLVTFILCFDSTRWYRRELFLALAAAALGVMAYTLADPRYTHELELQIGVFCTGLFIACMFCHGEVVRLKPAPKYLTRFYLMISVGGAVGSVLVGIVAPLVLPAYFELAGGLVLCALLLLWQARRDMLVFPGLAILSTFATVGCGIWGIVEFYDSTIASARNFYGVLRVQEYGAGTSSDRRSLIHGTILHGTQYLAPELKRQPTSYYTATSGIGRLLEVLHPRTEPLRVGVIGLGTGTLAAWGAKGDVYRFYDINPDVIDIARRDFTYLADSEATIETPLGDARLKLEREPPQRFDVLAIDAFSSDAIPVHLITAEAVAIYKRHLAKGGVIAFHVTNRFLNLIPVVDALAGANALHVIHIADIGEGELASRSDWMLLSENAELLARPELAEYATPIEPRPDWRLWTDDFNNLVQVLK